MKSIVRLGASASLAAVLVCGFGPAQAQEAAKPAGAAEPAPLPPIEVIAKKPVAKKKTAAKKKSPSPAPKAPPAVVAAPAEPAEAPPAEPAPEDRPGTAGASAPVQDYVATGSATGTKTNTPLKETPQSITVVGAEQVRDQGARTLQEAVRYVPGVLADGFGFDSRGDYTLIRGIEASIYLDGLRTNYGYYVNEARQDPYNLERVEVLRGPASMLYGQGSTGGIINAVSKRPEADPYREIVFEYGSFDHKSAKLDATGPLTEDGKWLYRVVGVARDADTQVDFVENDALLLAPSITYRPNNDTEITLLTSFRDDAGGSVQQFFPYQGTLEPNATGRIIPRNTFSGEPGDYYDTQQQSVSLLLDNKANDWLSFHHGSRYVHTENQYDSTYTAILTQPRIFSFNQLLTGAGLSGLLSTIPVDFQPFVIRPDAAPSSVLPFSPTAAPYLDEEQTEIARARTLRFTNTDIFNADTNATVKFDTGPVKHKLTGGYDVMYFEDSGQRGETLVNNLFRPDILGPGLTQAFDNMLVPGNFLGITGADVAAGVLGSLGAQNGFNVYRPRYNQREPAYAFESGIFTTEVPMIDFGQTQIQNGIYLQDQVRLGGLIGVFGLRHDWLTTKSLGQEDRQFEATTGRAGLMYEFAFGFTPYVSYSESFKPNPGTLIVEDFTVPLVFKVPEPVEGEQWEVGFKYQPGRTPLIVNFAAYDLTESNRIVQPDIIFPSLQGAEVNIRGLEVEVAGKVTENLKLIAAYTYTDAKYVKYHPLFAYNEGTPVEGVPEQTASLWGIYSFGDGPLRGLSLGAGVRYIGESTDVGERVNLTTFTPERFEVVTPSYTLFDAMVAYDTPDWRWQLSAQNLEDEYYVVSCTADRGDCGIGQARTIVTSFTYRF